MAILKQFLNKQNNQYELNYLQIRRSVGILGIALPIVVSVGSWLLFECNICEDSISNYYYSIMGNVFTGILCAVALFLYSYKGKYEVDNYASSLAAIFALGVAFFPMNVEKSGRCDIFTLPVHPWRDTVHFGSAAGLFLTLAVMSFFLFTRPETGKKMTHRKKQRNFIYRTCGIIMFLCCLLTLLFKKGVLPTFAHATFVLETIMLWAFGFSWLTKGETVLKDK
jgi:hypothetical protein